MGLFARQRIGDFMTGIRSEAKYSTFEAIAMIVGNSVGTGIIAVPYLATRTSMTAVVIMVAVAYCVNVVLHLIIAELSYNNGGQQLVKSFENELFAGNGRAKQVFSWIFFGIYGLAIMVGVAGNLNGGALILVGWFGMPLRVAQVIYYLTAGVIVFFGMKAVGVAQKYAVIVLFAIVAAMSVGAFMLPGDEGAMSSGGANLSVWTGSASGIRWNNLLALYSMVVFATSANQAVIQAVKGLNGDARKVRTSIFAGFGISCLFVLIVSLSVIYGTGGAIDRELAYMQLGENIGVWAVILAGIFSLVALMTTFWAHTLSLRDVVHEQLGTGNRLSWLIATLPAILFALFGVNSFIALTRIMSGVVLLVSLGLILTYSRSRRNAAVSSICGPLGTRPFRILMLLATILSAVGAVITIT